MTRRKALLRVSAFRAVIGIALVFAMALCLPSLAQAHDAKVTIGLDVIDIQTSGTAAGQSFLFQTSGQAALTVGHDPGDESVKLLVRGTGDFAGRTELIELDRGLWSEPVGGSYLYSDPDGREGGVTSVLLEPGALSIEASGPNWSFEVEGPQDAVWVHVQIEDESYCAVAGSATGAAISANEAGHFAASGAAAPGSCPEQVCGNGIHELGEDCDDGNLVDSDGCSALCEATTCANQDFATTWEAIETLVFEGVYACAACHTGSAPAGGLDLSPGSVYENIVDVPSNNFANKELYILPGEPSQSFLIRKLAAAAHGARLKSGEGSQMPPGYFPEELLEAFRLWVRADAPNSDSESAVVDGTAELLSVCLPPATPLKVEPPARPTLGTGVQFVQPKWDLPPESEDEICMATYYDLTVNPALVPEEFQVDCPGAFGVANPSEKCFVYHRELLLQDAQSHHSIIQLYTGTYDLEYIDPTGQGRDFGAFTYKERTAEVFAGFPPAVVLHEAGDACDPRNVASGLGYTPACGGKVKSTVACNGNQAPGLFGGGFGPLDWSAGGVSGSGGNTSPAFSGSQESYYDNTFYPGVYSVLPMQGVIVWNSHAFNLTQYDTTMEQYLNIYFAQEGDREHQVAGIFDAHDIFGQNTPPFETEEICATYTIPRYANLFRLNSHTHQWGVQFRIWDAPNPPCVVDGQPYAVDPACEPGDPDQLIYRSTAYADPVNLVFETPKYYDSENAEDRTFLYCSVYDNGSMDGSPKVKRQSTSPVAPSNFGTFVGGGPCPDSTVACMNGPRKGELCGGDDSSCDIPGDPGSGICDACPVRGGVTTGDEMLIALGSYYIAEEAPEPELTPEERAAIERSEELCSVAKARAASRDVNCRMRRSLGAVRRAATPDVSSCHSRLVSAYARAEARYEWCAEADTAAEQGAENQRFVNQRLAAAGVDLSSESSSGGSALSARCASQTARAIAAHYRCEGQALRQEMRDRLDTANRLRDRCATRIERALDRVQRRYRDACTESPDAASVIAANRRGAAAAASSD